MSKYDVFDTHNEVVISRHHNGINAMKGAIRHSVAIQRRYGKTSYIPKQLRKDGVPIGSDEYCDLIDEIERIGFNVRGRE